MSGQHCAAGPITAVTIFHSVADADGSARWLAELAASAGAADGFSSSATSLRDAGLDWAMAVTLRAEDQLHTWLDCDKRQELLKAVQSQGYWSRSTDLILGEGIAAPLGVSAFRHNVATGKGAEFLEIQRRLVNASFGPVLNQAGAQPWLALWVSQIVSVSALQWWLMPAVAKPFRDWLDPVDGAGFRISAIGVAAVIVGVCRDVGAVRFDQVAPVLGFLD